MERMTASDKGDDQSLEQVLLADNHSTEFNERSFERGKFSRFGHIDSLDPGFRCEMVRCACGTEPGEPYARPNGSGHRPDR